MEAYNHTLILCSAVMAIVGRWEMQEEAMANSQARFKLSIPIGDGSLKTPRLETTPPPARRGHFEPSPRFHSAVKTRFERLVLAYVDLITSTSVATIVCLLWTAFLVHSVYVSRRFFLLFSNLVSCSGSLSLKST